MGMLGWYGETLIAAMVLAVVCEVMGRGMRLGPAVRHALWVVVLVKMVTPVTGVRWPSFGLTWEPGSVRSMEKGEAGADVVVLEEDDGETGTASVERSGLGPGGEADLGIQSTQAVGWSDAGGRVMDGLVWVVLLGAVVVGLRQLVSMVWFARWLKRGVEAPEWLRKEVEEVASRMRVGVPKVWVVAGVETPLVWCLGRPVLVVPAELLERLPRPRWEGIVAHELGHVKRGDPLVGWLLLVAEWFWWWCPLYWWVRGRIESEAELACDALAVGVSGGSRREYAEALLEVCTLRGRSARPLGFVPVMGLGRGGASRLFERRLKMIVRGKGVGQLPWKGRLAVGLMLLVAVPGWGLAQDEGRPERPEAEKSEARQRERQERRARLRDRREQIRAEMERARAEMERAQAEMRRRLEELQERMREEMERVEAEERAEAEAGEVRGERPVVPPELEGLREEMTGILKELENLTPQIRERLEIELRELGPELREQLERLGPEVRGRVEREMERALEEVRRARRAMRGDREGRPDAESGPEAPQPPELPARPGREARVGPGAGPVSPPRIPGQPNEFRMPMGRMGPSRPGSGPMLMFGPGPAGPRSEELERRMERLEQKFDTLLEEIRALRNERARGDDKDDDGEN
ncbi:MAG: hypothetical protein KatS3mg108_3618 [Isosphaeraceae bacterium]|jgi:beta-lactamase regulating signal transducer with metallopeptidase domain|nr:MAG: hypothetical protein KatS3mg108_3618 [Isosphaeraceae bacterium]